MTAQRYSQSLLGTALPCISSRYLYLSDLPISPLARISARSAHSLKASILPYFHHQAGSSSAHPRHPVIRVSLDLQCQLRNSKHHRLLEACHEAKNKARQKVQSVKRQKKVGQKTDVCLTVMKKKRAQFTF